MKNIKYTSDGKKVVVIGNLNSIETIVQEVYIVDGSEIPSGEHFVVKSLHDAPAVSWKDAELKKLEDRYKNEKNKYEKAISENYNKYKTKAKELAAKIDYVGKALKSLDETSFELLRDFISGDIKYIVIETYEPTIVEWSAFNQMYEDKLRLISIFGKDDGTLKYAIGAYYDHSGPTTHFHPFKDKESATSKLYDLLIAKGVSQQNISTAKANGISFPKEMIDLYVDKKRAEYERYIANYESQIKATNDSISLLSNLI